MNILLTCPTFVLVACDTNSKGLCVLTANPHNVREIVSGAPESFRGYVCIGNGLLALSSTQVVRGNTRYSW